MCVGVCVYVCVSTCTHVYVCALISVLSLCNYSVNNDDCLSAGEIVVL